MPGINQVFATQSGGSGLADLAYGVMEDFQKDQVAQTQRYQAHPGVRRLLMVAESSAGGPHRTDIRIKEPGNTRFIAPFEITANYRVDLNRVLYSNYKHIEGSYIMDEKEDAFTSRDDRRINDHLQQQYNGVITEHWDTCEGGVWGNPASSGDQTTVVGMRSMLPGLAASETSNGSFNGRYGRYGNGVAFSVIQGQDLTDTANARLTRWAATYDGSIGEQTFAIINAARLATAFQFVPGLRQILGSPGTGAPAATYTAGGSFLAVPTTQFLAFADYANKKISDGSDGEVNRMFGEIMVDGMLIVHVPYLDNFSDAPLYAINTQELYGRMLTDRMFKWLKPQVIGVEHWKMACVSSFLLHNRNPRKSGFVIHKQFT